MNVVGASDQFDPLFPDDFLPDIIGRLFIAWDQIPKPITEILETRITKLLRHRYANDPVIRKLPMRVVREFTIDDPVTGEELGRIDLCLLHGNDESVYFAFECKRLNVTFPNGKYKSLAGAYVGPEGMGCFVSEKYAVGQRSGGMIGYVFDSNVKYAYGKIATILTAKPPDLSLVSQGILASTLLKDSPELYETEHDVRGNAFIIYHLFLQR